MEFKTRSHCGALAVLESLCRPEQPQTQRSICFLKVNYKKEYNFGSEINLGLT